MSYNLEDFIQLSGEIFERVQSERVFPDSKTFVDMIPRRDPESIKREYQKLKSLENFSLKNFVDANFELPSYRENELSLPENRSMSEHINLLWNALTRKADRKVKNNSLVQLKYPYVVPGGRFREIYYWDTYFTMHGLLNDEHIELAQNMIKNFEYVINRVGHIPNGNRLYYLSRSQPPFFASMVRLVADYKNDPVSGTKFLPAIEKEYNFWMNRHEYSLETGNPFEHTVPLNKEFCLNRYHDSSETPREESYFEDYEIASDIDDLHKASFYKHIRAACESGWDFSSRWFNDGCSLKTCRTTDIIPVDLNSLLYSIELYLSKLYKIKGNEEISGSYNTKAKQRKELISTFFWSDIQGFYFDYNFVKKEQTNIYSLAACYPLYFRAADQIHAERTAKILEREFLKEGGLMTTLHHTGQQWDAPNGWAPLQWIAIKGLRNYNLHSLADEIKKRWLKLNNDVFERTGQMYEKYNVEDTNLHAGGGEYELQDGFGWTNGVASALMNDLDLV